MEVLAAAVEPAVVLEQEAQVEPVAVQVLEEMEQQVQVETAEVLQTLALVIVAVIRPLTLLHQIQGKEYLD